MQINFRNLFQRAAGKKSRAQSLVEYGLILALVSIVAIAVLNTMGGKIKSTVQKVNDQLDQASTMSQSATK